MARYNWDSHLQLHAGVTNLLNKKAPYDLQTFGAPGNGAEQGGAPYNPSYHQDGAVGPMFTVGAPTRSDFTRRERRVRVTASVPG